jgi:hypothetical protein
MQLQCPEEEGCERRSRRLRRGDAKGGACVYERAMRKEEHASTKGGCAIATRHTLVVVQETMDNVYTCSRGGSSEPCMNEHT